MRKREEKREKRGIKREKGRKEGNKVRNIKREKREKKSNYYEGTTNKT